jgi:hypothetical protein
LTQGEHTIMVTVMGQPKMAAVDPFNVLIDQNEWDNYKLIE